jgi:hypothetical protein
MDYGMIWGEETECIYILLTAANRRCSMQQFDLQWLKLHKPAAHISQELKNQIQT